MVSHPASHAQPIILRIMACLPAANLCQPSDLTLKDSAGAWSAQHFAFHAVLEN